MKTNIMPNIMLFRAVYADEEGDDEGGGAGTAFTQEQVNTIVANERKKQETRLQEAVDELNALKTKTTLTKEERDTLEGRIADLSKELKTKEQLSQEEQARIKKKFDKDLEEASGQAKYFQEQFVGTLKRNSIIQAATQHDAFHSDQVMAIVGPLTQVMQRKDDDGNLTDMWDVRVNYPTEKDGKAVTLDLSVSEAVARMKEDDKFFNLFKPAGTGGFGRSHTPKGTSVDMNDLARKDPQAYIKARLAEKAKK